MFRVVGDVFRVAPTQISELAVARAPGGSSGPGRRLAVARDPFGLAVALGRSVARAEDPYTTLQVTSIVRGPRDLGLQGSIWGLLVLIGVLFEVSEILSKCVPKK